jgi:uncharacterized protein involved in type VI secretion and phage assembly
MNLFQLMNHPRDRRPESGRIYGVVIGIVTNTDDPDNLGRVKLRFPWLSDSDESNWARIVTLLAGNKIGAYFPPMVDDEVLVAFQHGDVRAPFVLGMLWNGVDPPPLIGEAPLGTLATIRDRAGQELFFDDRQGGQRVRLQDKTRNNFAEIDSSGARATVQAQNGVRVGDRANSLELDAAGHRITVTGEDQVLISDRAGNNRVLIDGASGAVTVSGAGSVSISSPGQVSIDAGSVSINAAADLDLVGVVTVNGIPIP